MEKGVGDKWIWWSDIECTVSLELIIIRCYIIHYITPLYLWSAEEEGTAVKRVLCPSPSLAWSVLHWCGSCPPWPGTQRFRAVPFLLMVGGLSKAWNGWRLTSLCWALFPDCQPYLKLLGNYSEAYQRVLDPEERFALVQVITDVIHRCPRFDLSYPYFIKAYREECTCLRLHLQLVRGILTWVYLGFRRFHVRRGWKTQARTENRVFLSVPVQNLGFLGQHVHDVYL